MSHRWMSFADDPNGDDSLACTETCNLRREMFKDIFLSLCWLTNDECQDPSSVALRALERLRRRGLVPGFKEEWIRIGKEADDDFRDYEWGPADE